MNGLFSGSLKVLKCYIIKEHVPHGHDVSRTRARSRKGADEPPLFSAERSRIGSTKNQTLTYVQFKYIYICIHVTQLFSWNTLSNRIGETVIENAIKRERERNVKLVEYRSFETSVSIYWYFRYNWSNKDQESEWSKTINGGTAVWWSIRAALSPNRPLPQGQGLDKPLASVESTADVNNRVSSEQNKLGSVDGFRKGGNVLLLLSSQETSFVRGIGKKKSEKKGRGEKKRNKRGHKSRA